MFTKTFGEGSPESVLPQLGGVQARTGASSGRHEKQHRANGGQERACFSSFAHAMTHTLGGVVVAATLRARGKVVLLCLVVAAGKSHGRI